MGVVEQCRGKDGREMLIVRLYLGGDDSTLGEWRELVPMLPNMIRMGMSTVRDFAAFGKEKPVIKTRLTYDNGLLQ